MGQGSGISADLDSVCLKLGAEDRREGCQHVLMNEQRLQRIAHAGLLSLAVHHDAGCHLEIG